MPQCRNQVLVAGLDRRRGFVGARSSLEPADVSVGTDEHGLHPGQLGTPYGNVAHPVSPGPAGT
jgi:hypothetical protein